MAKRKGSGFLPGTPNNPTADDLAEARTRRIAGESFSAITGLGGGRGTRTVRSGKVLAVGPSTGGRGSAGRPV